MLPFRNLGSVGVITDVAGHDLPPNALTEGNNIRFHGGKLRRGPVYRKIADTTSATPAFTFTLRFPGEDDRLGIVDTSYAVYHYLNGTETLTGTALGGTSTVPFTYSYLQGVGYLNRATRVPQYFTPLSASWADLTNWDPTWRCRCLRAYKDYLIALDVSKGATRFPTMVKWSDIAQYGDVPPSWDHTLTTNNAGENILGDATSPFLDGQPLRDAFIVYNSTQVYAIAESNNYEVFRFRKLFDNQGVINTNCVVEAEGLHFVFGPNDIYAHDGTKPRSICNKRVRKRVYSTMATDKTDACFAFHYETKNEIWFCYQGSDELASFKSTDLTYCNRAAVYNYVADTWSFSDVPNAGGATQAELDTFKTYEDVTTSYEVTGGTYYDMESGSSSHAFVVGHASADTGLSSRIYGLDDIYLGLLPFEVDLTATKDAIAYRVGLDLDEIAEEVRSYKFLKAIYPQMDDYNYGGISFKFTATDYASENPFWPAPTSFDPLANHKVSTRTAGRYLGWYIQAAALSDFQLSGFDADIVTISRR